MQLFFQSSLQIALYRSGLPTAIAAYADIISSVRDTDSYLAAINAVYIRAYAQRGHAAAHALYNALRV